MMCLISSVQHTCLARVNNFADKGTFRPLPSVKNNFRGIPWFRSRPRCSFAFLEFVRYSAQCMDNTETIRDPSMAIRSPSSLRTWPCQKVMADIWSCWLHLPKLIYWCSMTTVWSNSVEINDMIYSRYSRIAMAWNQRLSPVSCLSITGMNRSVTRLLPMPFSTGWCTAPIK